MINPEPTRPLWASIGPPADGRLQASYVGHCRGRACLGERGDTERVGAHWR
jgi:hypothetical protein